MSKMQQQSHGIKLGEISMRRRNIWIYSACYTQSKKKKKAKHIWFELDTVIKERNEAQTRDFAYLDDLQLKQRCFWK